MASVWYPLLVVSMLLPTGCKHRKPFRGQWHSCKCQFITDFDDPAEHSLEVCVPQGAKAEQKALECASRLTLGPAQGCRCTPPHGTCNGAQLCKSADEQ